MNDNPDASIEREREIFLDALEKTSPEERKAFLDRACGNDAALRARVESLLRHHSKDSFLEEPAVGVDTRPSLESAVCEGVGTVIGRYKLLQKIGEGGMGVVYMAEQEEPVRRKVALKVIKLGMDTKQVVARFEAERQALALMDHPNIAKVLDGGATNAGRPFFVMELVQGVPITEFCDKNQFSVEDRVKLFIPVCQAIQSAHQKGIIHRDLKPTNILVTLNAGVPHPMVIDFGVAKATNQKLTEKTVFTNYATMIGTPAYMSPEQAEMSRLDVDTRTDIHGLGVLLYELLTGTTPFPEKRLRSVGYNEMQRIIMEEEPDRPSTRLRRASITASGQNIQLSTLREGRAPRVPSLATDLDWIVMKCLEKDRARRYETANGLATDLQRHLDSEPVIARPPSNLYRFQKLVRRNKLAFAAGAVVSLVVVFGLGLSTWMFLKEQAARKRAVTAEKVQIQLRQQAQAEAKKSEQVAKFLKDMLQGVGPSVALGRDTTMLKEILDRTAQRVGKDLNEQPEVEWELRNIIGQVYYDLGEFDAAGEMHRKALETARKLPAARRLDLAESLHNLARALAYTGPYTEAAALEREAIVLRKKVLGAWHPDVAASLDDLAYILYRERTLVEAEQAEREALAIHKKAGTDKKREGADALNTLGLIVTAAGRLNEAELVNRETLAVRQQLFGNDDPDVGESWENLSEVLDDEGKLTEAESDCRRGLATRKKLFGVENPAVQDSMLHLTMLLVNAGKLAEAESLCRERLTMVTNWPKMKGSAYETSLLVTFGDLLVRESNAVEAEAIYRRGLEICRPLTNEVKALHYYALGGGFFSADETYQRLAFGLGNILKGQGKTREAEALYREAVDVGRKSTRHSFLDFSLGGLGDLLREQGDPVQAEAVYREGLDLVRKFAPGKFDQRQWLASGLAYSLQIQGKWAEAEVFYREAVTNSAIIWGNDPGKWQWQVAGLAAALKNQGKLAESETFYRQAVTTAAILWPQNLAKWEWQFNDLVEVLQRQGKAEEAEQLRQKYSAYGNSGPLPPNIRGHVQ
jgi:eukaryotic-like serine/threonine-protein kinase